ncbi:iron-containing redox enzyme family protein [Hyalangium versicolor]|uniref:iron-containing redox enzyme family protein n=1 Tax=Hyalangium versicolor TaxID=2861190 RepID=UPI001CC95DE3|nr:iron-containing redox enzyme family protein [Hyalangium versicolor]
MRGLASLPDSLTDLAGATVAKADHDPLESLELHQRLHRHYTSMLAEPEHFSAVPTPQRVQEIHEIERSWIELLDARTADLELPSSSAQFKEWYLDQAVRHTAATSGFSEYLTHQASLPEIAMFIVVEEKVDSRFDDLMALAQLGTSGQVKLIIGENYWDEMGHGNKRFVHTTMFNTSVTWMREKLQAQGIDSNLIDFYEMYANANQLLMYGLSRRHAPRLLGALGVLEHTASQRFQAMVDGCTRHGVPPEVIDYQFMHVGVDHNHGAQWLEHVLLPLIQRSPRLMEEVCRGVLTRCDVAIRYYAAVKARLFSGEYR